MDESDSKEGPLPVPDMRLSVCREKLRIAMKDESSATLFTKRELDEAKTVLLQSCEKHNQSTWYKDLCEEFNWPLDKILLQKMELFNEKAMLDVEARITDAKDNFGDIEQRDATLWKAECYQRIGDRKRALDVYDEALRITVGVGARMDNVLTQIRINFFDFDKVECKRNIERAKSELARGGDWEKRNKLKVYNGIYLVMIRDFESAANLLMDSLATFTATELLTFEDYVLYTVITCMVALDRQTVRKEVEQSPEVLSVANNIPYLKNFLTSLYDCKYKDFFRNFVGVIDQVRKDRFLAPHLRYFNRAIRLNAYKQFLTSYKSVTLEMMGEAFGVSSEFIDDELSSYIAAGKLFCKIDRVNGVVEAKTTDSRNEKYAKILKQGDLLLNRIQKLSKVIDM